MLVVSSIETFCNIGHVCDGRTNNDQMTGLKDSNVDVPPELENKFNNHNSHNLYCLCLFTQ